MLVFGYETLDLRHTIDPNVEEGEEGGRAIDLGQFCDHTGLTGFALPPWKRHGWRVCRTS